MPHWIAGHTHYFATTLLTYMLLAQQYAYGMSKLLPSQAEPWLTREQVLQIAKQLAWPTKEYLTDLLRRWDPGVGKVIKTLRFPKN